MTVNEAIRELEQARDQVGGSVPLLMPDGLPVTMFPVAEKGTSIHDGPYVAVSDVEPIDDPEDPRDRLERDRLERRAREALRRYGVDPDGMDRRQLYQRLEREAECGDIEAVVGAVLGGMDYEVRLPGQPRTWTSEELVH
jgi:hypothetical protein